MRIRRRSLDGAPLVRDWLSGHGQAAGFFPNAPGRVEVEPDGPTSSPGAPDRREIVRALDGGGPDRETRLRRFVEDEGFVVTTGQQPVLFGGPLFVLCKALTAITLAERLEERTGRPVLPVFWIASEDHDWEEARGVWVLDAANELRRIALPGRETGQELQPLHRIVPGATLPAAMDELLAHLPSSDFAPRWTRLLQEACTEGATLPEAFAAILDGLLGDRGLFLLQAHAPVLKASTRELLLAELEGSRRSAEALRARAERLEDAGYGLQVPVPADATNLFFEGHAGRDRLMQDGDGGFRLRRSGEAWRFEGIRDAVAEDPARLSPNVLFRPVVERAFLPTLAYVAGPGEIAYLAQTAPLFEAHHLARHAIQPRLSVELVERKVGKVLEKHGLESDTLARPHHELAGELVRDDVPEAIRRSLGAFRGALAKHTRELADAVSGLDPTLTGPVEQVRSQGFQNLDDVERKVVQALKRENRIALEQLEKAQRHLYPGGRPQERALTPWYYLFRYGDGLIDRLADEARAALEPGAAKAPEGS